MAILHRTHINPNWPVWYSPDAALGYAVRYLASLSSRVHWVGAYVKKKKKYQLRAHIGTRKFSSGDQKSEIQLPIHNGKLTGKIVVLSHAPTGFSKSELQDFQKLVEELARKAW